MKTSLLFSGGINRHTWYHTGKIPLLKNVSVFTIILFFLLSASGIRAQETNRVSGTVTDQTGAALIGVSVRFQGTQIGASTDENGKYSLNVPDLNGTLVFTYIGYKVKEVPIGGKAVLNVQLAANEQSLNEVVVTGYGTQTKGSLTGAISTITSKDIDRVHGGSTVSSGLAGKLPGVSFRMPDGRPGASANIQIRNMGNPLYVIDGIQQDAGQFNNLAPTDIESITILKDASAAIYGVRAANGVVVVTTKKGSLNEGSKINVDAYLGFQNWTRFPEVLNNSYEYMSYVAAAQVNSNIFNPDPAARTNITQSELDKYKAGTEPGYQSFDWRSYVMNANNNAPQNQINVNFTGGSDKINYYVSATNFFQNSQLGSQYKFNRSNIQSNIHARVANGLKVGLDINGRIESRENPGVPGTDDYWLARFAILRDTPLERPFANDNPLYLNDLGQHLETNYAFLNEGLSGKYTSDWRVLQTNFTAEYDIPGVKGLNIKGAYSYYIADELLNNQEYTYKAYTYRPETDTYDVTGGSTNPWREREQRKELNQTLQGQINYNNTFGKHTIGGIFVAERIQLHHLRNWIHASPVSNNLPLIYFPTSDQYQDSDDKEARIGYIGRINYNYANKYYVELSGRRDASYLFAPGKRVGYFPGGSVGWRITEEPFMKSLLGDNSALSDLKFRASYGVLGDDRSPYDQNVPIITPYAFLAGYNYNLNGNAILDGDAVTVARDKGIPVTNLSWMKSKITDIGADFVLFDNKLSGTIDYFYRKRTGLPAIKNDVLIPQELGYSLPQENLNSDAQYGEELSLAYNTKIGEASVIVGGNVSYSRSKFLHSYNPLFFNSWDQYRNSTENRLSRIDWGYETIGQFQSFDQINSYDVNIDGQGNRTLIPGDLIYKDQNGDKKIDEYDQRPIGYGNAQPNVNFGFNVGATYKNFDFNMDFSGAAGYTWFQDFETRWAFQNDGNLAEFFTDSWHRADVFDVNSEWIPGKYPANRYNPGNTHSDYSANSTFWAHNVWYFRARTIQLGYTLPGTLTSKAKIQRARVYINAYNLFSLDNLKEYGIDPEVVSGNGLDFPQSIVVNLGINVTF